MRYFFYRTALLAPVVTARFKDSLLDDSKITSKQRILFLSDLDGTLIQKGSNKALASWVEYWQREEAPKGSVLCYNTARCIKDYLKLVEDCSKSGVPLPVPDVLITGEGTEIRWRKKSSREPVSSHVQGTRDDFALDKIWQKRMDQQWRESGAGVRAIKALSKHDSGIIKGLNDLDNSPPNGECRFTISTQLGASGAAALAADLQKELGPSMHVYSMEGWGGTGPVPPEIVVCLPKAGGKAHAARYVAAALEFPLEDCVSAGDTKGDASMLSSGIPFICVGNSSTELVGELHSELSLSAFRDAFNGLRGGTINSKLRKFIVAQEHYAAGAIEGLINFRRQQP